MPMRGFFQNASWFFPAAFFLTMLCASAQDVDVGQLCNNTVCIGAGDVYFEDADGGRHGDNHQPVTITIGALCNVPGIYDGADSAIELTLKKVKELIVGAEYQVRVTVDLPVATPPLLCSHVGWKFPITPAGKSVAVREYLNLSHSMPLLENVWLVLRVEVIDSHPSISAEHSRLALVEKTVYLAKCASMVRERELDDKIMGEENEVHAEYNKTHGSDERQEKWDKTSGHVRGGQEGNMKSIGEEIGMRDKGGGGGGSMEGDTDQKEDDKKQEEETKARETENENMEMHRDVFAINFLHDQHSTIEVIENNRRAIHVQLDFTLFPVFSVESDLDVNAAASHAESASESPRESRHAETLVTAADRSQELQFYLNGEFVSKATLEQTHSRCGWKVVGRSNVALNQDVEGCDATVGVSLRNVGGMSVLDARFIRMRSPRAGANARWHPVSRLYFSPQRGTVALEQDIIVFLFLTSCEVSRDFLTCVQALERLAPLLTTASEVRILGPPMLDSNTANDIKAAVRCARVSMIGIVAENFSQQDITTGRMIHRSILMDPLLSSDNVTLVVMEDNLEYPDDYFAVARRAVRKASHTIHGSFAVGQQGYDVAEKGASCEVCSREKSTALPWKPTHAMHIWKTSVMHRRTTMCNIPCDFSLHCSMLLIHSNILLFCRGFRGVCK